MDFRSMIDCHGNKLSEKRSRDRQVCAEVLNHPLSIRE